MNFIKKTTLTIIITISLCVIIFLIISFNPLRRSEERIAQDVLQITPLGMHMDEVIEIIENHSRWGRNGRVWINLEFPSKYTNLNADTIKGEKSIKVHAGWYMSPLRTDVEIYWGFDENSYLIEVGVRKTVDSV